MLTHYQHACHVLVSFVLHADESLVPSQYNTFPSQYNGDSAWRGEVVRMPWSHLDKVLQK